MAFLETERLVLRPTHPDLFDELWAAIEASLPELRHWMPWAITPDQKRTRAFLERAAEEWQSGHERHFTVIYEDQVCGQCSLDHADLLNASYEMGYWMHSDLCGRGLMTEAAREVVRFGFAELDIHRIGLRAGTKNTGSIRVAEKVGFKREGILRDAGRGAGGFHDSCVFGLLVTDERH